MNFGLWNLYIWLLYRTRYYLKMQPETRGVLHKGKCCFVYHVTVLMATDEDLNAIMLE